MRVVVCAALVALVVTGTGLFSTQPVAGQENKSGALHGAAALERLKRDGQYESLQAAMDEARFSVNRTSHSPLGRGAWHAPNPAAGYDAYVTEEGVSIAVNDVTYVSLNLNSIGYGEALQSVAPGEVSGDGQTINLTRYGRVREWFVNGPDGLEHGFTIGEPVGARHPGMPLRLAMQVSEGWHALASEDGKAVTLRGANAAVEYGKLVVRDGLGRNIHARLTVADEQVVIEVEDHDATYPLTIDPLFTLQQKLLASDGAANDYLGYAVALSGNTALVGAPYDNQSRGSAYLFVRNGSTWTQRARLFAQDGAAQDYFGYAVALDGDTALVGAILGPGAANANQGAVYVFTRNGANWTQQARLNANETLEGAQFGAALALDGNTALVGAHEYTSTPSYALTGAVYVFVRNGTNWTQQARLLAGDADDGDAFGRALALEGDTALIGAPNNAVTAGGQGSAYVFIRNGSTWTQQQRLMAINAGLDDHFGNAVALSGEKALIGAYLYGSDDRGAVFTFVRGATGWTQTDRFFAPNPTAGAQFGVSLALDGDTAVVGASRGLYQPGVDQHSAYVFARLGDWEPVRQFGPELGTADDRFGYAVALDGDTVLVGAYRGDATAIDQGAAYAFVLRDSRHLEQQKLTANDGGVSEYFGHAVALSGDTLAVGARGDSIGANPRQGSVYIFTRSGATWTLQQKITAADGAADDYFGFAVALSGDTLAVGAYGDDISGLANVGSVYIFTRNGTVWTQQQRLNPIGIDTLGEDRFGSSVALGGNTLLVGIPGADGGRGSAYVFIFDGTIWKFQAKLHTFDSAQFDHFGHAVALDGDTAAVGVYTDDIGVNAEQGSVYVFTRSGTAWAQQAVLTASDGAAYDYFGGAVAVSGDTLAVGAHGDTIGANGSQGSVYVFARTGTTWTQQQKLTASDGAASDFFGIAVALSGSILVVGAHLDDTGTSIDRGSAYVFTYLGYWHPQQKLTAGDGAMGDDFGRGIALSGDTVAVGAPTDDIGTNIDQGSAYVFVSPSCPALTIAPNSLPDGAVGAAYNQQLTASGSGAGDYQFTVSSGALPPGLSLDPPGLLHGAPTEPGTYRFTITTTFLLSLCTGSRDYTITVTASCPTVTIEPPILPDGVTGVPYSQTLTVTASAAPYTFGRKGTLPPGLSLGPDGVLSGTPTKSGKFSFTALATDANGCTASRKYTLTITQGGGTQSNANNR
jgi:hypothetical protein